MRRFAGFLVVLATVSSLIAQELVPDKQKLIRDVITQFEAELDRDLLARDSMQRLLSGITNADWMSGLSDQQRSELSFRLGELIRQQFRSRDFLERVLTPWLDRTFSAAELQELLAFSRTPAGGKAIGGLFSLSANLPEMAISTLRHEFATIVDQVTGREISQEMLIRRTAADIRSIATAAQAYATDYKRYPPARDIQELKSYLSPTYIRNLPEKDPWGTPYLYVVSTDGEQYRIVSGGADHRIDPEHEQQLMFFTSKRGELKLTDDPAADVVYQDGSFRQIHRSLEVPSSLRPPQPARPLPPGVFRVGGDVRPPRVIERVDPQYPPDARAARVQGIVIVEALIDATGKITELHVLKGLPYGLDQAALDAIQQWRFEPATREGRPVPVAFNLTVNFKLDDKKPPQ